MRRGILADIHGRFDNLSAAIELLLEQGAEEFIVLGDVIDCSRGAVETVELLNQYPVTGVWGNHELGLCHDVTDSIRERYSPEVMEFFGRLQSHVQFDEVLVSHALPQHDPTDPAAYYTNLRPGEDGALDATFSEHTQRLFLVGHFHRWFAATTAGPLNWLGESPLRFDPEQRYLVVVHAVMQGWCALLDDEEGVLTPLNVSHGQ